MDELCKTEEEWKDLIIKNFNTLTDVVCPHDIAGWLRQNSVLKQPDYEDVTNDLYNAKVRAGK